MTQDTDREKLEHSLMALFSKCTSFGFSFGHTTTKEEFAEMLSKGESLDHQEAAHEAMKLIDVYIASQRKAAEIEARIDELKAIYAWSSEERDALVFAPEHRSEDYAQMAANGMGTRITVRERIKELQAQKEAMK